MRKILFCARQLLLFGLRVILTFAAGGSRCAVCGAFCRTVPVCAACRKKYFSVEAPSGRRCSVCGRRLVSEDRLCMQCRAAPVLRHADGVFPIFSYRLWNAALVCRWKIDGERTLSPFFAARLTERLRQLEGLFGPLVMVPVPPRPGKIRREGWDQIEELCAFLRYRHGFCVRRLLARRSAVEQKTLDRQSRLVNTAGAYVLRRGVTSVPPNLCLIDDVMTTGATVEQCCAVLKGAGAVRVLAATLFSAD